MAERFAALGDPTRLHVVEALALTDLTSTELREIVGVPSNLLAHHLRVLESAGLVRRRPSSGDRRRRYVSLVPGALRGLVELPVLAPRRILFVCRRNSARSQMAAALWNTRDLVPAESAGPAPAQSVHPGAVREAARHGVDLEGARPRSYDDLSTAADLVVSVCDVAREDEPPFPAPARLHWSIPDPADAGTEAAFRTAWQTIARRVDVLAEAIEPSGAERLHD